MIRVITTNKHLIEKFDIKYVSDELIDDNWIYVYVHFFHSKPIIVKLDKDTKDINTAVLNKLIEEDRKKKIDNINNKIRSKQNIFKRLFR